MMRKVAKKQDGRSRAAKQPTKVRRVNFQLRLSPEQLEQYTDEARAAGISVAEWLRRAAAHAVGRCATCGRGHR